MQVLHKNILLQRYIKLLHASYNTYICFTAPLNRRDTVEIQMGRTKRYGKKLTHDNNDNNNNIVTRIIKHDTPMRVSYSNEKIV